MLYSRGGNAACLHSDGRTLGISRCRPGQSVLGTRSGRRAPFSVGITRMHNGALLLVPLQPRHPTAVNALRNSIQCLVTGNRSPDTYALGAWAKRCVIPPLPLQHLVFSFHPK